MEQVNTFTVTRPEDRDALNRVEDFITDRWVDGCGEEETGVAHEAALQVLRGDSVSVGPAAARVICFAAEDEAGLIDRDELLYLVHHEDITRKHMNHELRVQKSLLRLAAAMSEKS